MSTNQEQLAALDQQLNDLQTRYAQSIREFLGVVEGPRGTQIAAFDLCQAAGLAFFNAYDQAIPLDSRLGMDQKPTCYTDRAETSANVLETICNHYKTLRQWACDLEIDPRTLHPSLTAFANMQRRVAETQPAIAAELRERFVQLELPTQGFDIPEFTSPKSKSPLPAKSPRARVNRKVGAAARPSPGRRSANPVTAEEHMPLMMAGVQYAEIAKALAKAFDAFELKQMLLTEMDIHLDHIIGGGPFGQVVFNLVGWAERRGRVVELIRAAYRERPGNDQVRTIYQKFGLAPTADLQKAGKGLIPAPQPVTDFGLEKTVKTYIPDLDFGLWLARLAKLDGRVCRVEVGNKKVTMGTGFLVGPDALLTAYHVLAPVIDAGSPAEVARLAEAVRFRFDFKQLADGSNSDGVLLGLRAEGWLLDSSPPTPDEVNRTPDDQRRLPTAEQLDYALLRLARPLGAEPLKPGAPQGAQRGWVRLPEAAPAFPPKLPILILQHPRQGALKLAIDTSAVIGLNDNQTRVLYETNTAGGASGAPCFDIHGALVALHHFGDPALGLIGKYNQGVPINLIRERIVRNGQEGALGGDPP
jgi:hypothetical protein